MTRWMVIVGTFCLACLFGVPDTEALSGSPAPGSHLNTVVGDALEFQGQLLLLNPCTGNFIACGGEATTFIFDSETGSFSASGVGASPLVEPGTTEFSGVFVLINPNTGNLIAFRTESTTFAIHPEMGSFEALGEALNEFGPVVPGGVLETPTGGFGSLSSGFVEIVNVPDEPTLFLLHPTNAPGEFGDPIVLALFTSSSLSDP